MRHWLLIGYGVLVVALLAGCTPSPIQRPDNPSTQPTAARPESSAQQEDDVQKEGTVQLEQDGIYFVDGTEGPLPSLLEGEDLQRILDLRSTTLGPTYKILSAVSPDDAVVLASHQRDLFFVNLEDGSTVPIVLDKPVVAISSYTWLDAYSLGFLTTQPNKDAPSSIRGVSYDRRTGTLNPNDSRLDAAALASNGKTPVLFSPNGAKLLLLDTASAAPMRGATAPSAQIGAPKPSPGIAPVMAVTDRAAGLEPLPGMVGFIVTEGGVFSVVDVESGVEHEVYTVGADEKVLDVSFSEDGSKFSLTSVSLGDSTSRLFEGALLTDDGYVDAMGELAPDDNLFFQSNKVTMLDFPSGEVRTLRAADGDGMLYDATSWSPDNQTLLIAINKPGDAMGRRYLQYLGQSQSGGSLRFYNSDLEEILRLDSPEFDSPQKDATFISNDEVLIQTRYGTNGQPYIYTLSSGELRNIADRPGVFFEVTPTNNSDEIVFVYSSFTDPPEYARMGRDGTGFTTLTSMNEQARSAVRSTQHPVSFTLKNGETFEGVLVLPANVAFPPQELPIVVWQAGGPGESVSNTWSNTMEGPVSLLPNFGYGVLVTPLYGRFGFSAERFNALAGPGAFGTIDIDAMAEIVEQVRAEGWASKVGVVGCSYGGYFVTQSIVRHPATYDAAHTMCSIVDMVAEWSRGDGLLIPWFLHTSIYDNPQAYIDVSPIYHTDQVQTPLLAFHGTADFLPIAVMENFMSLVLNTGTPAKLFKFKDGVHGFANLTPKELSDNYELYGAQEQLLWFREYLGQ